MFCQGKGQALSHDRTPELFARHLRDARKVLDARPFRKSARLFWSTSRLSESGASSVRFTVSGDGQWHDYRLPVGQNPRWRGVITRLRLDPCSRSDVKVSLEYVRLETP